MRKIRRTFKLLFSAFLLSLFIASSSQQHAMAAPSDDFVTTWKTDNSGISNATSITIPTSGSGYNYNVDWNNDGTFDQFGIAGSVTHDFGTAGTYTIRINGAFPVIRFAGSTDKLKILSIDQWGSNPWTSMFWAFNGAANLQVDASDAPNLANVTNLYGMFDGASSVNADFSDWNTSNATTMYRMFNNAISFNGDISTWDTSNVADMSWMFNGASQFNGDISGWDTSNVTKMFRMFYGATNFNQGIGSWVTSNVTDMGWMFYSATLFNQNIDSWDTSNVTTMSYMFRNADSFNQPLNNWDTSKVTDFSIMFYCAKSFNQPLSNWDTSSATTFLAMFSFNGCSSSVSPFNQDISMWDTSNVTDFSQMFVLARSFNQPIGSWDTSKATSMAGILQQASSFNQNIGTWNIENVTTLGTMFYGTGMSVGSYDATLQGWSAQILKPSVMLNAWGQMFCSSQVARQYIIDTYLWTFSGDSFDCSLAAPSDVAIDSSHSLIVSESTLAQPLGVLITSDATASDSFSYSLTCTTPGAEDAIFSIAGASNDVLHIQPIDYENAVDADTNNIYEVCVRVTDATANTFDQLFTITIADVYEAPPLQPNRPKTPPKQQPTAEPSTSVKGQKATHLTNEPSAIIVATDSDTPTQKNRNITKSPVESLNTSPSLPRESKQLMATAAGNSSPSVPTIVKVAGAVATTTGIAWLVIVISRRIKL